MTVCGDRSRRGISATRASLPGLTGRAANAVAWCGSFRCDGHARTAGASSSCNAASACSPNSRRRCARIWACCSREIAGPLTGRLTPAGRRSEAASRCPQHPIGADRREIGVQRGRLGDAVSTQMRRNDSLGGLASKCRPPGGPGGWPPGPARADGDQCGDSQQQDRASHPAARSRRPAVAPSVEVRVGSTIRSAGSCPARS